MRKIERKMNLEEYMYVCYIYLDYEVKIDHHLNQLKLGMNHFFVWAIHLHV